MNSIPAPTLQLADTLRERVLLPLSRTFVGKDEVVDVLGVCLVGGEHAFLHGPPGTAKSALVHELGRRLQGNVFGYLLTRFTEPSELFGPFDLRRLREGELITNTAGMLPEAELVFLDELLNANSAILNSLLGVLNERVFRRGRETRPLPMLMAVGASNALPEDEALLALFDRFLLRVRCDNVPPERLGEVLHAGWQREAASTAAVEPMSADALRALQRAVPAVGLRDAHGDLVALVQRLRRAGVPISDRRAVKLQRLCAASALLCGRASVVRSDLWVFRHIWDNEPQQELLAGLVDDFLGAEPQGIVVHPAAHRSARPDGEALAAELERLASEVPAGGSDEALRLRWQDQVRALASRAEWVEPVAARSSLRERIAALWAKAGNR